MKKPTMTTTNEEGNIIVVLPLTLMLIAAVVFMVNIPLLVTSSDVTLKNSVAFAVKAAANQHEIESVHGNNEMPLINFHLAKNSFESVLTANLEFDNNLEPKSYSSFTGIPNYTILIYNGQRNRSIPPGIIYEYQNGQITESRINQKGFPRVFTVSNEIEVVFDSPGVVAVVEAIPRLISKKSSPSSRWAMAVLIKDRNDKWKAVLQSRDI